MPRQIRSAAWSPPSPPRTSTSATIAASTASTTSTAVRWKVPEHTVFDGGRYAATTWSVRPLVHEDPCAGRTGCEWLAVRLCVHAVCLLRPLQELVSVWEASRADKGTKLQVDVSDGSRWSGVDDHASVLQEPRLLHVVSRQDLPRRYGRPAQLDLQI